ncbi:hypothetical protein HZC34_01555 [Candidatus Saganbacteria bacterium]|nr:hypothetical protein [Candidatus Saganbacteria bacterium]
MADMDAGAVSSKPITFYFEAGTSVVKDEVLTPDFKEKTLNSGKTVESTTSFRLRGTYDKWQLNINADYAKHVSGAVNPFYPEGFRPYELSFGAQDLSDGHFDFKVGRFPVLVGRTYGIVDGGQATVHSQSGDLSLTGFGGFKPEKTTLKIGKKLAFGAIATADIGNTFLNLNYHEVLDGDREPERKRLGFQAMNESFDSLEIRTSNEYDPLNNTVVRLQLGSDYQLTKGLRLGTEGTKVDPTFEPGSFFNTFPHFPYYKILARAQYRADKLKLALNFGQTRFESDTVNTVSGDITFHGANIGSIVSRGSSVPYLNYTEAHAGYDFNIKDRLTISVNGSAYFYDDAQFNGNRAYYAGGSVRWEFASNFVLNASGAFRKNVDGVIDPLLQAGLTFYYANIFSKEKK